MTAIDLSGRTTIVIGGSRGIGAETCRVLADCGSDVAFSYLDTTGAGSERDRAAGVIAEIEGTGRKAAAAEIDASESWKTKEWIDGIAKLFGGVNGLIYCAGYTCPAEIADISAADWRHLIEINLSGAFYATQAALPHLSSNKKSGIVFVGSGAVYTGGGGRADYVSAKAGLEGLNRAVAREYAAKGVRCNLVHPSLIDTELLRTRHPSESMRSELAAQVPLKRLGSPSDIANLAAFLLSDLASYITGQAILVDGGRTFLK